MFVAQLVTVWAPASSRSVWSEPGVKLGGSSTGLTVIDIVAGSAVPSSASLAVNVNASEPK